MDPSLWTNGDISFHFSSHSKRSGEKLIKLGYQDKGQSEAATLVFNYAIVLVTPILLNGSLYCAILIGQLWHSTVNYDLNNER